MFEWDERKRQRTIDERGIDFAVIGPLFWDGRAYLEAPSRTSDPEPRFERVARIEGRVFLVVWTPQVHDAANRVRIISARKINDREVKALGARLPT